MTAQAGALAPTVDRTIFALALMPPLFWAGNFVVAGLMRDAIPPLQMSFLRWVLASAIMVPFAVRSLWNSRAVVRGEIGRLSVFAFVGVTAFNSLIYLALHHTSVVNAALLNATMPVITFVLAFLIVGQRLSARQTAGAALALVGALVVALRGDPARLMTLTHSLGDLLVLCAVSAWALYTVLLRRYPSRLKLADFLLATFVLGTLFHLPLVAWEFSASGGFVLDGRAALALLYFAVFPSILAYVLWGRAVAALGPSRTAIFMYAMPVFTALLAVLLIGERLYAFHAVGAVLIVAGLTLVTRQTTQPAPRTGHR